MYLAKIMFNNTNLNMLNIKCGCVYVKDPEWNFSHDFKVPDGEAKIFRWKVERIEIKNFLHDFI